MSTYVHLVGGRVFDNYCSNYLEPQEMVKHYQKELKEDPKNTSTSSLLSQHMAKLETAKTGKIGFAHQLKERLGNDVQVVNHAFNEFTTISILEGDVVGKYLPTNTVEQQTLLTDYLKFKGVTREKRVAKPLERLKSSIDENKEATHYVVIDVGFEDVEGYWKRPWSLKDVRHLPGRCQEIVNRVKAMGAENIKPIFVIQPRVLNGSVEFKVIRAVAIVSAVVNAVSIATFVITGALAAIGKVNRLKAGLICLAAGIVFHALRTNIAPLTVTMGFSRRKDIGMLMIQSIWERLYRPVLKELTHDNDYILDLASSHNPYSSNNKHELLLDGIHYIVNEKDSMFGGKRVFSEGEFTRLQNNKPDAWSPKVFV